MRQHNNKSWQLNRQIGLSTLVQLGLLAVLIIGSWVNLQRQLDLLQHDVTVLLECQKRFEQKIEKLSTTNVSHEYRIAAIERRFDEAAGKAGAF